jgi:hypothetical protein
MKIRIYRTKQRCAHGHATPWWVVDGQGKTAAFTTWRQAVDFALNWRS